MGWRPGGGRICAQDRRQLAKGAEPGLVPNLESKARIGDLHASGKEESVATALDWLNYKLCSTLTETAFAPTIVTDANTPIRVYREVFRPAIRVIAA